MFGFSFFSYALQQHLSIKVTQCLHINNEPAHEILVFIALSSSKGSGDPVKCTDSQEPSLLLYTSYWCDEDLDAEIGKVSLFSLTLLYWYSSLCPHFSCI